MRDLAYTADIIVPCFNGGSTLARAIRSARQNEGVRRIIVADDGSTDDSIRVARDKADIVVGGDNAGACVARNRGLAQSTSEFVLFLDADDHMDPGFVDFLISHADEHCDLVVGSHREINSKGKIVKHISYNNSIDRDAFVSSYLEAPIQTGAVLWRKRYLAVLDGWDEAMPVLQDIELMLRAIVRNARITVAPVSELSLNWEAGDSPQRISNSENSKKAWGKVRAYALHSKILAMIGRRTRIALQHRFYRLARSAFVSGHAGPGAAALKLARRFGLRGHLGTRRHRILCALIGLKAKVRLTHG